MTFDRPRPDVDLGIEGRIALVTGGSAGLGRATARALSREGARVAIAARTAEGVDRVAATLDCAAGFVHDVSDAAAAPELIARVEAELGGPVDILVANTGGPPPFDSALGIEGEVWQRAYESLVLGPLALVEAAVPGMRERGWGRVISISSSSVREPIDRLVLSTSHRSALLATLKQLAREVAADGVTINSVLPGRFATDRIVNNYGSIEAAQELAATEIPIGRLGTVEEFADVVTFLASARASYVTGTAQLVDGGLTRGI